jgi:flagellar basal-body rod protein FlgG
MLEGLYAAASGMEAQQTQLDAVSNDLSNMDTAGYKSTIVGFRDLLYTTSGPQNGSSAATGAGAAAQMVGRSQTEGSIQNTGQPLDLAIEGSGYLQVRRPDGTIGLTRNGALQVDANDQITTKQGMPLVPPITIPQGVSLDQVKISPDGTVQAGARTLGKLSLVDVPAPNQLLADGDSVFSATAGSGPTRPAAGATVQQGALESSNVDMAQAMTQMITAQENYSLSSKAVQFQDQMMSIADQVKR